jgi:hypothetical protein
MRVRSLLLATVALFCAGQSASGAHRTVAPRKHHKVVRHHVATASAGGVSVLMDEVRIVTFPRPIATVFVGNPMIADATVIDQYHAFVLGKTFGVTNLIALGPQSQTVANQQITVANRSGGVVTLNKGGAQYNYSCTVAHCESGPRPGDQKTYFDETEDSISKHQDQSVKAASVSTGGAH